MASASPQIAKDTENAAFKAGNWAEAIGHYSAAVVADRTNPTYPLNRAAAYLKLAKYQVAERDCTTVLNLDARNVKAYFRRAQARVALQRYAEAEKDLHDALKLEPANAAIKAELAAVQKQIKEYTPKPKREPISVPSPSPAPPAPRQQRRVWNVPIDIIEPKSESGIAQSKATPEAKTGLTIDFLTPVQSRMLNPQSADTPAPRPSPQPTPASQSPKPAAPPRKIGAAIFHANGKRTILRTPGGGPTPQPLVTPRPKPTPAQPSSISSPVVMQPPPQTYFQLTRAWAALPTATARFTYLKHLTPSLPALFKSSHEPAFLISLLKTFQEILLSSPTAQSKTEILFLSKPEKEVVKDVWSMEYGCESSAR
ncbi:hypothetical protein M422DRAFT_35427 [Sphaerobolus stellatus SS14]|uniref:RNA polymerase II-associated protein 3 n=1 Tax=Sphaerobolus stellatus (strain SS14) TaxID=990650 RepID=A0A0C9UWJ6_SPHS4|nr:hypothetical protein M422DRAFT_35427 [Sphaerobolus stellatus SS14]